MASIIKTQSHTAGNWLTITDVEHRQVIGLVIIFIGREDQDDPPVLMTNLLWTYKFDVIHTRFGVQKWELPTPSHSKRKFLMSFNLFDMANSSSEQLPIELGAIEKSDDGSSKKREAQVKSGFESHGNQAQPISSSFRSRLQLTATLLALFVCMRFIAFAPISQLSR